MVRPVRHKKPVNYSQFENSDSDDDFVSATAPLNKKPRTTPKELKLETRKPKLKNLQKEDIPAQEKTPKKRMALDDKLYQRDLEVALALSVKELPTVTIDVEEAQDKSTGKCGSSETGTMNKAPHISNCSVASDYLGEESEDDSDFSESEGDDEDFTMGRNKVKEMKKKEVKVKSPAEKKEKKPKSKCDTWEVTSGDSLPAAMKSESQPSPKKVSLSSEVTRKPPQIRSPSAESRKPKWVPPVISGSSSSSSKSPLPGVSIKSPNQSLRLGLSRLARVKPLHPNAASS
ncbi:RAD51-associated protein 1 isoform X2 [Canis lupus baileyi]|uniref:RAD51-associated protein 1 isoform X2 n=1 Tax=Canis lupus dingo TaxID=286419 RepID=UPI0015F19888|nr:RAD51-associated protein 1 isoform X2 [Canis lupus dingo]XP_038295195.1 RAD51-associated protein 1 isoform X2 [Canis lupus familiaris]XP_038315648.1 RAD51-associated protein 1 isoform X2 [Canis lupus familiaris]XP_038432450.1 RAD51-associated protein 1 isoform X2 [Canis lupus familiaris]